MRKKFSFVAIAAVAALALSACGGGSTPAASSQATLDPANPTKITVGVSPVPHGEIVKFVKDNLAKDAGLDITIKEFDDYVLPNEGLADKSLDVNYFQHLPYLEEQIASRGYKFEHGAGIHLEHMAAFSAKYTEASQIPDGSTIVVTNDPANQLRSLRVLETAGLLKNLAEGDSAALISDDRSADKNPKKLHFEETQPEVVVKQIADPAVAAAVVNGNFVLTAKIKDHRIAVESPENNPFANFLVWRTGEETPAIKKLDELLHSPEVKAYIEKTWPDKTVIPAF